VRHHVLYNATPGNVATWRVSYGPRAVRRTITVDARTDHTSWAAAPQREFFVPVCVGGRVGGWVYIRGLCVLNRCASISQACVRFERVPIPRPTRGAHSTVCTGVAAPRMNARLFVDSQSRLLALLAFAPLSLSVRYIVGALGPSTFPHSGLLLLVAALGFIYAVCAAPPPPALAVLRLRAGMAAAALCRSERPARVVDEGRAARGVLDRRSCTAFVVAQKYHSPLNRNRPTPARLLQRLRTALRTLRGTAVYGDSVYCTG
jgi:hypothetical protein